MPNDFKRLMYARFLFQFGVQMQAVALGWRMYDLTHDPLQLGFIGLSEAIPAIGIALYAGYVVDRSRPIFVYQNVILGSLLSAFVLLFSQLFLGAREQIAGLIVASVITGAARGFSQPAMFAAVPRLLARDQLTRGSAWMSTAMQVARVAGPALGGFTFGWFGIKSTSALVCALLLLALLSLLLMKNPPGAPAAQGAVRSRREELFSGARFVLAHRVLFPAMSLDMISVFFGGVTALLPVYAAEILHVGPKGLGILRAAPAFGAAFMGLWLTRLNVRERAGSWLFTAVSGFGACVLVFALSRNYWLSVAALGLSGAFDSVSMVVRGAAVQLFSPEAMRGRISAVNSIFIGSSNELGEFESGVAAHFLGAAPAAVFGGVVCLVTVGVVYVAAPALRALNLRLLERQTQ